MQAASRFKANDYSALVNALGGLGSRGDGLIAADTVVSPRGSFARFIWADWPLERSRQLEDRVRSFHDQLRDLHRVQPGSEDWAAVFHGWRSDLESAEAIQMAFSKHFEDRLHWVESERDARGRIAGLCMIKGLGEVTLDLSWRNSQAIPSGTSTDKDMEALRGSISEVFHWAERRIQPILDALHDKLKALYGERFRGLYVFGSYAKPDAGVELSVDSDLDVALILSDFENRHAEIEKIGDITYDLSLAHGLAISVTPIREADYQSRSNNFIRVISEYAIPAK